MEGIRNNLMHFGMLLKKKMNELHETAVNERCSVVSTKENEDVTDLAIAISAKDFYEQYITEAKSQGIQEEQTPSLS